MYDYGYITEAEKTAAQNTELVLVLDRNASEKNDETLMEEMEVCYKKLKESFSASNEVQALAHVLSIAEGSAEEISNNEEVIEAYLGRGEDE